MALFKTIKQDDGVPTSYHRILFVQSFTNSHTAIAVLSYINEEGRQSESDETSPYKACITYQTDYVENMTIEEAYDYLKTLPNFEGAQDV